VREGEGSEPEPGFQVELVRRLRSGEPVRDGGLIDWFEWMDDLSIIFDEEVEPETSGPATCFVTLEMPWPLVADERRFLAWTALWVRTAHPEEHARALR
jgi:hypothetical protein